MGQDVEAREFSREDRTRYRAKVRRCLDVFARMLSERDFSVEHTHVGVEIEFNLVDDNGDPALKNVETLEAIADDAFQTELGLFNIEINVPPSRVEGRGLDDARVDAARRPERRTAQVVGGRCAPADDRDPPDACRTGTSVRDSLSANPRYHLLSDQILAARGEDIEIVIEGVDRLSTTADTIIPEAACTSTQLHLQVEPDDFAPMWNAAQAIAGAQVAIGANSPFLLGQQLWHETRIALFEQATDTRSEELKTQGVRPRVFFGERWITSVFDLFEENVRYFPALLPIVEDEDPVEELEAGRIPSLSELRLHNGTIYRWNGRSTTSPTVGRTCVSRTGSCRPGPRSSTRWPMRRCSTDWSRYSAPASDPCGRSCRSVQRRTTSTRQPGSASRPSSTGPWSAAFPHVSSCCVTCCPRRDVGLEQLGVDQAVRDRLLGIIESRCTTGRNGSTWLIQEFEHQTRSTADRAAAMRATTQAYEELMHAGEPVHTLGDTRLTSDLSREPLAVRVTLGTEVDHRPHCCALLPICEADVPVNPAAGSRLRAVTKRLSGGTKEQTRRRRRQHPRTSADSRPPRLHLPRSRAAKKAPAKKSTDHQSRIAAKKAARQEGSTTVHAQDHRENRNDRDEDRIQHCQEDQLPPRRLRQQPRRQRPPRRLPAKKAQLPRWTRPTSRTSRPLST